MVLCAGFVWWEKRTTTPMVPLRLFKSRDLSAANGASLLMYFGLFGSIFLLTQFLQAAQGYSPLQAGLRVLPWTLMPMFVAPAAGVLSDRIGGGMLMAVGLAIEAAGLAWIALIATTDVAYSSLIGPFVLEGVGSGLFFAPVANVVLSAVATEDEGKSSGVNNAVRELGGVFGVAVLASVFSHYGSFASTQSVVDGLTPALWLGAATVGAGAFTACAITRPRRHLAAVAPEPVANLR
jgi:nitrate/nitrite transporter NarK